MRLTTLSLLVLAFAGPAFSQSASRNAATWYRKAIEQYEALSPAQRDLIQNYEPAEGPPSPELRTALSQVQSIIQNYQRGANQEHSDFGLDKTQGVELLLPHLNPMRGIAKLTRTDVLVRLHDGDSAGAADRLASLYKVGGHGGADGTIISSLVGQAVFQLADNIAQTGIDSAAFNAADSAKLLGAMKQLGTDDPFNYVEGVAGEQEYFVDWIADNFAGEDGPARFTEMMGQFDDDERLQHIAALDLEQFQESLDQHDAMLNRAIEIFSMSDPEKAKAEMNKLSEEIEHGEHGPFAMSFGPSLEKVLENKLKGERQIAARIELFSKLAAGEANPEEVANAAIWYLRAIELLEKTDAPALESLRIAASDPNLAMTPELAANLLEIQPTIDVFREASQKRRCDFSFARAGNAHSLIVPSYAPGMHDGMRFVRLDAQRLLAAGDGPGALDRLGLCWRIAGHLGDEPPSHHPHISGPATLTCSLIAQREFNAALSLMEQALKQGQLSEDAKPVLRESLSRIGRKDPFGYITAMSESRKLLQNHLYGMPVANQDQLDQVRNSTELAAGFDVDRVFFALVIFDTLHAAGQLHDAAAKPAPPAAAAGEVHPNAQRPSLDRMNDLLRLKAFDDIRSSVPEFAPELAQFDWRGLAETPIPEMFQDGTLSTHMRRARGDLRRAHLLLRHADAAADAEAERSGGAAE